MTKLGLLVRLDAKPGKENQVEEFLNTGLTMAREEVGTPVWFALRLGPSTFGIFDAFDSEENREAHLNGSIAKALMANAPNLLAKAPTIEKIEVIGSKS